MGTIWNKISISAIASFLLAQGIAGLLAHFGNTLPALIISILFTVLGVILFILGFKYPNSTNKEFRKKKSDRELKLELINQAYEIIKKFRMAKTKKEKDEFIAEFEKIKLHCNDYYLDKKLSDLIEYELECEHFHFNYYDKTSILIRDRFYTNLRKHILNNTKENIYAVLIVISIVALAIGMAWIITSL